MVSLKWYNRMPVLEKNWQLWQCVGAKCHCFTVSAFTHWPSHQSACTDNNYLRQNIYWDNTKFTWTKIRHTSKKKQIKCAVSLPHLWSVDMTVFVRPTGLQSEHFPETAVEWPSAGLQRISWWLPWPWSFHVGLHLETRSVLCQWKGSQFPRGYYWQQAFEDLQKRECFVQYKVRGQYII